MAARAVSHLAAAVVAGQVEPELVPLQPREVAPAGFPGAEQLGLPLMGGRAAPKSDKTKVPRPTGMKVTAPET